MYFIFLRIANKMRSFWLFNKKILRYIKQNENRYRLFSSIDVRVNDNSGIATVIMNTPPVNALKINLIQEMTGAFRELNKSGTRGIILTSAVPGVFSSGLDINELIDAHEERFQNYWYSFQELCLAIYDSSIPTAAAITGHAPAGGCCLALCCQYRVMLLGNYGIGLNETKFGIGVPNFLVELMRHATSSREAERAVLSATLMTPDEALNIGLIDNVALEVSTVILECEEFLKKMQDINKTARNETSAIIRRQIFKIMKDKEKAFEDIAYFVLNPEIAKIIKKYKESLKK